MPWSQFTSHVQLQFWLIQVTENDVIEEEDDSDGVGGGVGGGEDRLCPTDQDLDSLAFERDLEEKCLFAKINGSHQNIPEECEEGSDEDGRWLRTILEHSKPE